MESVNILWSLLLATAVMEDLEVPPTNRPWSDVSDRFDRRWLLPMPQLQSMADAPRDLEAELEGLLSLRWEPRQSDAPRCIGDWLIDGSRLEPSRLETLLRESPLDEFQRNALRELFRDSDLKERDWAGEEDSPDDGVLICEAWDLSRVASPPWNRLQGRTALYQGAALVKADAVTIKTVENDYRTHWDRPGSRYEALYPVADSYARGMLADGTEYSLQQLYFRVDLPFPFSDYECRLNILNRLEDGRLVCDVYSTSEDFYWLAGRDTYLPVFASDGSLVATAVVKRFGFDLDGVPDGEGDILAALRSSLGFMKRDAENAARDQKTLRPLDGQVPPFRFLGRVP